MGGGITICKSPCYYKNADALINDKKAAVLNNKDNDNNIINVNINIEEKEINVKKSLKNSKSFPKSIQKINGYSLIKIDYYEQQKLLSKKDKEINDLKGIIDDMNKKLLEKDNEINAQLIEINKGKNYLKVEKEKLIKEKKDINNLKNVKSALENEVKDLKKKLNLINNQDKNNENEKKSITQLKNELAQKENYIKNKENDIKIKENNIKIKENDINNKYKQLIDKENKLKKKEQELIQREQQIKNKENKNKVVLIGLNNIGATCYMNATLQCLSNTRKMTEFFLNYYKNDSNKTMSKEYYKVVKHLWDVNSNQKSYSPNSFKEVLSKENPLFAGVQANDSKDLINFLIERLHQELNVINPNKTDNSNDNINQLDQTNELSMLKVFIEDFHQKFNSPISNLFYGILETKSRCQGCNVIKFNFQIYSFLEFPLQQVNQYYFNNGRRPLFTQDGKNPDVDLYECFEYYRKIDLMNGENQMFCNICNKLCDTLYSTILYSGPRYLIINLNRGKGAVYECKVNFPEQLNLFNYITYRHGITAYELYAVICHLGPSSMSGHFVAYCRNRIDNKWYLYNDAFVTECTKKYQYNDGMPYILFYRALISD